MENKAYFQDTAVLKSGNAKYYKVICEECGCEFVTLKAPIEFRGRPECPQCGCVCYMLSEDWENNPVDISGSPIAK